MERQGGNSLFSMVWHRLHAYSTEDEDSIGHFSRDWAAVMDAL